MELIPASIIWTGIFRNVMSPVKSQEAHVARSGYGTSARRKLANEPDEMTDELRKMRPDETVTEWAFRFLQALPQVRMVLSGMSDMEQLKANIGYMEVDNC